MLFSWNMVVFCMIA